MGSEIGFIGFGRMGANMVERMLDKRSIRVVGFNRHPEPVQRLVPKGVVPAKDVKDLVKKLKAKPKVIWMMLPSGDVTEQHFKLVLSLLKKGDIIIDGANSNFHDSIRRHELARKKGIGMLDVGVSGGLVGAKRGYAMMAGGSRKVYDHCRPIFDAIGFEQGYDLVGEQGGSGHYVKMIHNAIEYGMMQAIAEGFDLLQKGRYKNLDLKRISHIWNHGTIVSGFLMEMAEQALSKDAKLGYLAPFVEDNGEGKWSAVEAMEFSVPFMANTYALHARYISRDPDSFAFRMLAAIRNEFGGHAIKEKKQR
ncbi:MAG: phosphogluconate dehydrogenase (NAD(+)-dependent, decarboxylating) [Nanoarchaeota archaeon]